MLFFRVDASIDRDRIWETEKRNCTQKTELQQSPRILAYINSTAPAHPADIVHSVNVLNFQRRRARPQGGKGTQPRPPTACEGRSSTETRSE